MRVVQPDDVLACARVGLHTNPGDLPKRIDLVEGNSLGDSDLPGAKLEQPRVVLDNEIEAHLVVVRQPLLPVVRIALESDVEPRTNSLIR